jgi:hypothetical protein
VVPAGHILCDHGAARIPHRREVVLIAIALGDDASFSQAGGWEQAPLLARLRRRLAPGVMAGVRVPGAAPVGRTSAAPAVVVGP